MPRIKLHWRRHPPDTMSVDPVDAFTARWQDVTAPELATAQSFGIELRRPLTSSPP
jgi:hypothetical protein